MGEQGIRSEMVALSQFTNLCGMPQGWEGCSHTLHRNYLLPSSNNPEQAGDEPIDQLAPVPPADSGLLADKLTDS